MNDRSSNRRIRSKSSNQSQKEDSVPLVEGVDYAWDELKDNDDSEETINDLSPIPPLRKLIAEALRKFFTKTLPVRVSVRR